MFHEYKIRIGGYEYPYYLSYNTEILIGKLRALGVCSVFIVYDNSINKDYITSLKNLLMGEIKCESVGISVGEHNKNIDKVREISEYLLECGIDRKSCIVALGGGVLGNIVGLVAGLLFRGIRLVHIPTTVMAATDSVLSLKQAVNTKFGKNLLGMFYKPEMVFTDYSCFKSLSKRDYNAGLVELIKNLVSVIPEHIDEVYGILNDRVEYTFEEFNLFLDLSIRAKCGLLINDMYEKKDGLVFEYGHTVGHAVEFLSRGEIRHGEGVAFGLMVESEISRELGYLKEEEVDIHYKLINKIGIIDQLTRINTYSEEEIWNVMKYDNKRGYCEENEGTVPMVLLKSLGECYVENGSYVKLVQEDIFKISVNRVFNRISDFT
ncbi:2-deoxy-scyllo-inosose synthase [Acetivibrio mesophilus]|uniref:3-dehydroquinate synthase n=1 Tax=Acetivibrio mesophilus TaxID=2487273 RepID=A0A4Q0I4E2_9FIRM|nr:2-deoxy-scyllo-inosose synthase [Acetivibrio mesophilus]ODM26056.1 hypothetical protein A7W90_07335 [Clostridium sp. Bc-iso-3]RXE59146.1 3-dehydroquinate synthase [Acetivibrio mesophilus]HHV28261.1 3-dehydroquinate synthase [Clostridium sp.]